MPRHPTASLLLLAFNLLNRTHPVRYRNIWGLPKP
jgi:hypothetical protein